MRRRPSIRALLENAAVVLAIAVFALLIANVISFATSRNRLPPVTRLGDIDVSGLTVDEAISRTATLLQEPVTLTYLSKSTSLTPDAINFRLNDAVAKIQLEAVLARQQGIDKLPAFMLRQHINPTQVELPFQYSEPKLQATLNDLATQVDRETRPPMPDLISATVTPGQDGALLDPTEASETVLTAMRSGVSRTVNLPVDVIPLGAASVKSLEPMLAARLKPFTDVAGNVAGVFVKDLRSGEELVLNGDVAFSGAGWLKLPLIMEAYRVSTLPMSQTRRVQLDVISSGGGIAEINEVLRALGDGDVQRGIDQLNGTLHKLGLRNTFLAQPFGQTTQPPTIVTPANARGDINAAPDPNAQSTVADIAVLLEMIEQCSNGTGGMILAFEAVEDAFTKEKCDEMLDVIGQNGFADLIAAGSGNATAFHRQAWDERNHGDAALVRSPRGNYVIAVMLHGQDPLNWADTSVLISDIARMVYGFFNGEMPPAPPPLTSPPPA